jgi:hypothetical protein
LKRKTKPSKHERVGALHAVVPNSDVLLIGNDTFRKIEFVKAEVEVAVEKGGNRPSWAK